MSVRDVKDSGGAGVLTVHVCERGRRDGGRVQAARVHTSKHINKRARDRAARTVQARVLDLYILVTATFKMLSWLGQ